MTGLIEGSDYLFRVSAENAAGASPASKELGPITAKRPSTPLKFVKPLVDQDSKVSNTYTFIQHAYITLLFLGFCIIINRCNKEWVYCYHRHMCVSVM